MVKLRTPDRWVLGSNPTRIVIFFWAENLSHICSSSPRCIKRYPDRAVFVQVWYSLSTISWCTLLEKGREIVSLGRLDCMFHKVAKWSGGVVSKGCWMAVELKVALGNWHLTCILYNIALWTQYMKPPSDYVNTCFSQTLKAMSGTLCGKILYIPWDSKIQYNLSWVSTQK